MSIFSDLKRVLFGAKSVTKSAAERAAEAGREAGEELMAKGEVAFEKTSRKMDDVGEKVRRKAGDALDKAKNTAEEITDKIWDEVENAGNKAKDLLDDDLVADDLDASRGTGKPTTGDKIKHTAAVAGDKLADVSEDVGDKVLTVGEKFTEKFKDVSEKVGEKVLEKGTDLLGKAEEAGDRMKEKMDEMSVKAEELRAEEAAEKARRDAAAGFPDKPIDTDDSLLDGKDDFFARADRFAKGDYHNDGGKKTILEKGDMSLRKDPSYKPTDKKPGQQVPGFEDLDGDGDELIDDAIIEKD